MKKSFRQGEAIVFEPQWALDKMVDERHPLRYGEIVYFLTDIPNVGGHCIVAKYDGKVVPMVHPGDFRVATEDEL